MAENNAQFYVGITEVEISLLQEMPEIAETYYHTEKKRTIQQFLIIVVVVVDNVKLLSSMLPLELLSSIIPIDFRMSIRITSKSMSV